tara:strand:- start:404 stop:637 length:234 start_codon:yes stop_codon:yes gene_type:complete
MKYTKSLESFKQFNENTEASLNEDREQQLAEFKDLLAELNKNKSAIENSIVKLNDRKAEALSKQMMDLLNTLYKLYR